MGAGQVGFIPQGQGSPCRTLSMTTLAIYATRAGPWQLKSAVHILITIKTTTES